MAFDFKKEYKEFYMPKNKPSILTVPPMNYIAVRGHGDPNREGSEYKQAIGLLYGIAFTIKILVGVGGVLAKALAIVMTAAAGVLFFCTSFSGGNAVIVILTATALFWLPELAGVLLAGLVLLQRKIADTFLV